MASTIKFPYEGKDYCLEFTKASVKAMEDRGFSPSKILDAPMTYLPELFYGAFRAHHPYINRKIVDQIYEDMEGKSELVNVLIEMYNEPIKALTEEKDGDKGNGIKWTRE